MSGPEPFRKPWFKRRKRSEAGWFDVWHGWIGSDRSGKPPRKPTRKPPRKPLPPGSGMPADPPPPRGPSLSGGAEAPLDYDRLPPLK